MIAAVLLVTASSRKDAILARMTAPKVLVFCSKREDFSYRDFVEVGHGHAYVSMVVPLTGKVAEAAVYDRFLLAHATTHRAFSEIKKVHHRMSSVENNLLLYLYRRSWFAFRDNGMSDEFKNIVSILEKKDTFACEVDKLLGLHFAVTLPVWQEIQRPECLPEDKKIAIQVMKAGTELVLARVYSLYAKHRKSASAEVETPIADKAQETLAAQEHENKVLMQQAEIHDHVLEYLSQRSFSLPPNSPSGDPKH